MWHSFFRFLNRLTEKANMTQIIFPLNNSQQTYDIFGVQTDQTLNLFNLQNCVLES